MSWATELRTAFRRLQTGNPQRVGFADQPGLAGALGREWNLFVEAVPQWPVADLTRQQRHDLRNRLAGILAAVHVLHQSVPLRTEDEEALRQAIEEARTVDARLQGR